MQAPSSPLTTHPSRLPWSPPLLSTTTSRPKPRTRMGWDEGLWWPLPWPAHLLETSVRGAPHVPPSLSRRLQTREGPQGRRGRRGSPHGRQLWEWPLLTDARPAGPSEMLARAPRGPDLFTCRRAGAGGTWNTKGRRQAANQQGSRFSGNETRACTQDPPSGATAAPPVSQCPTPAEPRAPSTQAHPGSQRSCRGLSDPSWRKPLRAIGDRPCCLHHGQPAACRGQGGAQRQDARPWDVRSQSRLPTGPHDGNAGADGGPQNAPAANTWGDGRLHQQQLWVPGSGPSVRQGRVIRGGPGWACRGQTALTLAVGVWVCAPPWRTLGGDQARQDSQAGHWPLPACIAGLPGPLACPPCCQSPAPLSYAPYGGPHGACPAHNHGSPWKGHLRACTWSPHLPVLPA